MIWIVEEIRTGWIFHRWQWVRDTGGSPSDYASSSHQWWKKTKQSMVSKSKSSDTILWKKTEQKKKRNRVEKGREEATEYLWLCVRAPTDKRLNWNWGTKRVIWGDNWTDPILLIDTKWPLGRVTEESDAGTDETKEGKEQQTWWVAYTKSYCPPFWLNSDCHFFGSQWVFL